MDTKIKIADSIYSDDFLQVEKLSNDRYFFTADENFSAGQDATVGISKKGLRDVRNFINGLLDEKSTDDESFDIIGNFITLETSYNLSLKDSNNDTDGIDIEVVSDNDSKRFIEVSVTEAREDRKAVISNVVLSKKKAKKIGMWLLARVYEFEYEND